MSSLDIFRCLPLGTKLTRNACGMRHDRAEREAAKTGRKGQQHLVASGCVGCPVGAAHRKGGEADAWPDGAPLELVGAIEPGTSRWTGTTTPDRDRSQHATEAEAVKARSDRGEPGAGPGAAAGQPEPAEADANASERGGDGGASRASKTKGRSMGRAITEPKQHTHAGRSMSVTEWAEELGVTSTAIYAGLKKHGTLAKYLSARAAPKSPAKAAAAKSNGAAKAKRPPAESIDDVLERHGSTDAEADELTPTVRLLEAMGATVVFAEVIAGKIVLVLKAAT